MQLDRACGPVRACRRCRDPAEADRAARRPQGRQRARDRRAGHCPRPTRATSRHAHRRRPGAMQLDRACGPVRACRRCRDPAEADRAQRDGRMAVSEQGSAALATALAPRERPLATRTAGEPERCTRAAHAGRCEHAGDAVTRCRRTARSETAAGPSASKGPARRPLPLPHEGDLSLRATAGEPNDVREARRRRGGTRVGDAVRAQRVAIVLARTRRSRSR